MILRNSFTLDHIKKLQAEYGRDPILLEKAIFAFGLLESLAITGLDFVFKGGTCLLLLLQNPRRLSTDIDLVTKPGTDIDEYINRAAEIFPFIRCEEQHRQAVRNIEKRHFKIMYDSPMYRKEHSIILDVVFEDNYYPTTVTGMISNALLETEEPYTDIKIPTLNCILGDKLTAFAPKTIGIALGINRDMDVMKQHHDVAVLIDEITDFTEVKKTYKKIAELEIGYRELDGAGINDTLKDSFNTAIAIIGRGKIFPNEYKLLMNGIRRLKDHVMDKYTPDVVESQSCRIAYLIANIMADSDDLEKITDFDLYKDVLITNLSYNKLNHIKRANLVDFAYLYEAIKLVEQGRVG